ncbi:SCO family protein [Neorhizobium sp. DT-125]|uniref:SCO family protein n=1 Tax=Neorhizobium sp. DT-125 TaxID=3396163 RepID=UPI003F1A4BF5
MRYLALLWFLLLPSASLALNPFEATGIDQRPGVQVPFDLPFTDEDGHATTLGQLSKGKPILLAPVLHNCPNICGVTLSGLMEAVRVQSFRPGRDFTIIAFGIDPKERRRDAANSLTELRKRFSQTAASGVHALTGTEKNIRAVTDALGYRYAWDHTIQQYAHLAAVAVLTPEGRLSRWLYGLAPAANDLKLALTEAGQGRTGSWGNRLLLLCYHYDPATGRYSLIVWTALRIGGSGTALIGAAAIAVALLRERRRAREGRT